MGKTKLREVKQLAQGHTTRKQRGQDSNPKRGQLQSQDYDSSDLSSQVKNENGKLKVSAASNWHCGLEQSGLLPCR